MDRNAPAAKVSWPGFEVVLRINQAEYRIAVLRNDSGQLSARFNGQALALGEGGFEISLDR